MADQRETMAELNGIASENALRSWCILARSNPGGDAVFAGVATGGGSIAEVMCFDPDCRSDVPIMFIP